MALLPTSPGPKPVTPDLLLTAALCEAGLELLRYAACGHVADRSAKYVLMQQIQKEGTEPWTTRLHASTAFLRVVPSISMKDPFLSWNAWTILVDLCQQKHQLQTWVGIYCTWIYQTCNRKPLSSFHSHLNNNTCQENCVSTFGHCQH